MHIDKAKNGMRRLQDGQDAYQRQATRRKRRGMIGEMLDLIRCADARQPWTIVDIFAEEWARYGTIRQDRVKGELELTTGGWSGNEAIIDALRANKLFFPLFWVESRRDGLYRFTLFDVH